MELVCKTLKWLVKITFENIEMTIVELKRDFNRPFFEMDADNVSVYIDDVKQETFGESFSGYKYNANETLESIVIEYLNNNKSIEWIEVPKSIRKFKQEFFEPSGLVIEGRNIPRKIIAYGGYILTLHIASDGFTEAYKAQTPGYPKDYHGCTAYTNEEDAYALLDAAEGNVITDIEAFYAHGIASMWKEDNIIFGKEELDEIAKNFV